jgi:predicted aspartyl protease
MGRQRVLAGSIGLFLLLATVLTSKADAQGLAQEQSQTYVSSIPFELLSDFVVVVQGQVGNLDGLRFILDTGSSHTVIDRRVADRLGLKRIPGRVTNFDRYIPVEWADVPQLSVGPIHAVPFRVMVANLSEQSEFGQEVDGILGLDLLSRGKKLAIDYERKLISIDMGPHSKAAEPPPNGFVVPVVVQGVPMHLLVDTGFRDILVYKERLRSGLPHLRTEGEPKKAVIGRLQATQINLPGVQIFGRGAVTPILLIDGPNTDVGAVDGYLGPTSLHAKRLELDFASKVLRWQ